MRIAGMRQRSKSVQSSRKNWDDGVNVAFGDGSVRFVKNTVSQAIWWYMNASDDGYSTSNAN